MTYVIGVTGGIGSGKTLVSDHFASLGVPVIDTDIIARIVVEPGEPALAELVKAFGQSILLDSGELNRAELRTLAFADTKSKSTLDSITHPAIRHETFKQVEHANYPYCLVVVPLLSSDSPFSQVMERILVVTANRQVKISRVQKRSGLKVEEIERIMQSQLSDEQRKEFADDIIANDGTIDDVYRSVEGLHKRYLALSKTKDVN